MRLHSQIDRDPTLLEALRAKVQPAGADECWVWSGARNAAGYGVIDLARGSDRKALLAHRLAYVAAHGRVPSGKLVLHSCDNPPCCNPGHLRAGTQADNMDDMAARGRANRTAMVGRRGDAHPRTRHGVDVRAAALDLAAEGLTNVEIGQRLGCHRVSVQRWREAADLDAGRRLVPSATYLRSRPAGVLQGETA